MTLEELKKKNSKVSTQPKVEEVKPIIEEVKEEIIPEEIKEEEKIEEVVKEEPVVEESAIEEEKEEETKPEEIKEENAEFFDRVRGVKPVNRAYMVVDQTFDE